jgi:deazaflavin-dependent oxidoreductase (nitroreductase family)
MSASAIRKKSLFRHLLRAPVYPYRWRLGPLFGKRFLLLTHTGRRTGVRHQTVLEVMEYSKEGPEAVVMSGFGRNSAWLRNIEATPNQEVVIGARQFQASHRFLSEEEAVNVVRNYELRNRFMAPLVRRIFLLCFATAVLPFFIAGLLFICASSTSITWERTASRRRPPFSSHLVSTIDTAGGGWYKTLTL